LTKEGWTVGNGPHARLALRRYLVDQQKEVVARATGRALEAATAVLSALRTAPELTPDAEMRCACGFVCRPRTHRACPECAGSLKAELLSLPVTCVCNEVFDLDHPQSLARHGAHGGTRTRPPLPFDVASKGADIRLLLVDNPRQSVPGQVAALPLRTLGQPRLSVIVRPSDDDSIYDAAGHRWLQRGARLRFFHRLFEDDHLAGHFPYATTATIVDFRPEAQLRVVH
jgi:hypothetical protein